MKTKVVKWKAPRIAVVVYTDSARYKGGFGVRSHTSDKIYKISFDTAMLCWKCGCLGCIRNGQCKHLDEVGLLGRRFGRQLKEAKKYGWSSYQKPRKYRICITIIKR